MQFLRTVITLLMMSCYSKSANSDPKQSIAPDIKYQELPASLKDKTILILGDSTMRRLNIHGFGSILPPCKLIKSTNRCGLSNYTGIPYVKSPVQVVDGNEGPFVYGVTNPGCTDCGGCAPSFSDCDSISLEYFPIEFAKDTEFQSKNYRYTQETIALKYIANRNYDFIIFSTGLHDVRYTNVTNIDPFKKNVLWYTKLLLKAIRLKTTKLIWLSTTAVRKDLQPELYQTLTSNAKLSPMNKAAMHIMDRLSVAAIDIYTPTLDPRLQASCFDGVHYNNIVYEAIAQRLVRDAYGINCRAFHSHRDKDLSAFCHSSPVHMELCFGGAIP